MNKFQKNISLCIDQIILKK